MSVLPRVLVAHPLPDVAIDLLQTKCNITVLNNLIPVKSEVLQAIPDHDALLGVIRVDTDLLDAAGSRLKIISTPSTGYDHLNVPEIKKRGIKIGNAPKVSAAAVAEIAIFLILGAARGIHKGSKVESGFTSMLGHDLRHKTVGIVGLGNIGVEIVKRLKPFEISKFLYSGHSRKKSGDELGAHFVTFDALLKESDIVICTAPLTNETNKMFNDEAFKKMKNTAVFVNVGRGKTVDTDALVKALKNNTIYSAGLDVTDPEPLPVDHELLQLPNAVITPHMGSQTVETRNDMAFVAVKNILNYFEGEPLISEV